MPNLDRSVIVLWTVLAVAAGATVASAQPYADTERVTGIDLAVELRSVSQATGPARKLPDNLTASDFEILVDGQSRPIVALAPVGATTIHPYQILIYVDSELADSRELQCSIDLLVSKSAALTSIAAVDFVVADPEPRFVLRDVSDPELLENLLASSDWQQEGGDQIRALRAGFIEALVDIESEVGLNELQEAFTSREEQLVQERLDLLQTFLADQALPGRQRVLLLVGLQFDTDPSAFYTSWAQGSAPVPETPRSAAAVLDESSRSLAAGLAAYGWISYPIAAPPQESPLIPGLRIGKWRLAGPAGGRIIGVKIARESERDPELAQAYLEKATALLIAGQATEAEEAFRRALHHFHGDPRTSVEQAEALVGLADAVEAQGHEDEARSIRAQASELDSSVATEDPTALATFLDPTAVLEILATETSGRVLHEKDDLEIAVQGLARRLRLTFQLRGNPRGEIYPVEARIARAGLVVSGPRWARFGSPPTLPIARARLLVTGGLAEPTLILDARVERHPQDRDLALVEFQLPVAFGDEEPQSEASHDCRVTAAVLDADEILDIDQRRLPCAWIERGLTGSFELNVTPESELVALVVEHLASGDWGAEIYEIETLAN